MKKEIESLRIKQENNGNVKKKLTENYKRNGKAHIQRQLLAAVFGGLFHLRPVTNKTRIDLRVGRGAVIYVKEVKINHRILILVMLGVHGPMSSVHVGVQIAVLMIQPITKLHPMMYGDHEQDLIQSIMMIEGTIDAMIEETTDAMIEETTDAMIIDETIDVMIDEDFPHIHHHNHHHSHRSVDRKEIPKQQAVGEQLKETS